MSSHNPDAKYSRYPEMVPGREQDADLEWKPLTKPISRLPRATFEHNIRVPG
jgi:hypothetical protein